MLLYEDCLGVLTLYSITSEGIRQFRDTLRCMLSEYNNKASEVLTKYDERASAKLINWVGASNIHLTYIKEILKRFPNIKLSISKKSLTKLILNK